MDPKKKEILFKMWRQLGPSLESFKYLGISGSELPNNNYKLFRLLLFNYKKSYLNYLFFYLFFLERFVTFRFIILLFFFVLWFRRNRLVKRFLRFLPP